MYNYKDMQVWQVSMQLCVDIHKRDKSETLNLYISDELSFTITPLVSPFHSLRR